MQTAACYAWLLINIDDPTDRHTIMITEHCFATDSIIKLAHMDAFHSITIPSLYIPLISHVQLMMNVTTQYIEYCLTQGPEFNATDDKWEIIASARPNEVTKFYVAPILYPRQFAIRIIYKHEYARGMITIGLRYLSITLDDVEHNQRVMLRHVIEH
jgi:hypothetical protein